MAGGSDVQSLLDALYTEVGDTIYARRLNLHLTREQQERLADRLKDVPTRLAGLAVTEVNTLDGTKLLLEDGSWFLIRSSGTEPVVRVYLDAHSEAQIEELTMAARAFLEV
jgi:phosphoglucomutase